MYIFTNYSLDKHVLYASVSQGKWTFMFLGTAVNKSETITISKLAF